MKIATCKRSFHSPIGEARGFSYAACARAIEAHAADGGRVALVKDGEGRLFKASALPSLLARLRLAAEGAQPVREKPWRLGVASDGGACFGFSDWYGCVHWLHLVRGAGVVGVREED